MYLLETLKASHCTEVRLGNLRNLMKNPDFLPGPQTMVRQVFLSTATRLVVVDRFVVALDVDVLLRRRFGEVVAAVVVLRRFRKTRDVAATR